MPKAKKKNIELEENEFLKDLIDEVKAIDPDTSIEIDDDSENTSAGGGIELGFGSQKEAKRVDLLNPDSVDSESEGPELQNQSTAFINLSHDMKVPAAKVAPTVATTVAPYVKPQSDTEAATQAIASNTSADRTVAVAGARKREPALEVVVESTSTGLNVPKVSRPGHVYVAADASLAQSETLKLAQARIHELENEVDMLRRDNDDLASAGDIISKNLEDLQGKALKAEKEKKEISSQLKNEILIIKGHLQYKETELSKAKTQIEDLDLRIKTDFKKIRVRERELENRLELVRAEKQALMRSKDERILDLQRKVDQFKSELDVYRSKVQDLNKSMEDQQEQMRKTVRALRVALSNLEHDSPIDESQLTEPESDQQNSDE